MKKVFFFIDDTIWVFRDLARKNPKSIFELPFLDMLKTAYERYGVKTQLNLFYRTDFAYGDGEFTLAEVPDKYKAEFEANSDWLKLAFHAKQEFPDYPYVNVSYEEMDNNFKAIYNEVCRFAGEKSFSFGAVTHWIPISREGVQALYDNGVRILMATYGEKSEYNGDPFSLPYGHAARFLQNKKPETALFTRRGKDIAIARGICGHNHLTREEGEAIDYNFGYIVDKATGMKFKTTGHFTLNLEKLSEVEDTIKSHMKGDYMAICDHEQYFYPDYFAYQPDYAEKIYEMGRVLRDAGYTFITGEEMEEK